MSTPSRHDGWTPQLQEQVQPGDPWLDPDSEAGPNLTPKKWSRQYVAETRRAAGRPMTPDSEAGPAAVYRDRTLTEDEQHELEFRLYDSEAGPVSRPLTEVEQAWERGFDAARTLAHALATPAQPVPSGLDALREIRELIAADWPDEAGRLRSIDAIARSALQDPA